MTALLATEVTIGIDDGIIQPWGMTIGDPFDDQPPPTLIFTASDVHQALRQGSVITWPSGDTFHLTRNGIATVTTRDGHCAIYELFPARFDDDLPYTPPVYVGRWPD